MGEWLSVERDLRQDIWKRFPGYALICPLKMRFLHSRGDIDYVDVLAAGGQSAAGGMGVVGRILSSREFEGRTTSMRRQLPSLWDNWFLGDFAGQMLTTGKIGDYIHNYLSFWRQYGLMSFVLFILCFVGGACMSGKEAFCCRGALDGVAACAFSLAVFNLVEICVARSYATPFVWMSVGFFVARACVRKGSDDVAVSASGEAMGLNKGSAHG